MNRIPSRGPRTTDDASPRALDALRRLVAALRSSSRTAVKEAGVTGAQLFVLQQIASTPGCSIGALADRTLTRQHTVSEVVTRLVKLGLVRRAVSNVDARQATLTLTARGRVAVAGAPATVQARLAAALIEMPAARRQVLADSLEEWLALAGLDDEAPAMFFERPRRSSSRADGDAGR